MYVILAGVCLMCMMAVNVKAADDIKEKLKGKWEITVPQAPDEYQKFNAEFKIKDGVMLMDFKGGDLEINDQKLTEKDGKLTANIYVGEYVKIIVFEEKNVLKGTADTSMGTLPFTLKKVADKKK